MRRKNTGREEERKNGRTEYQKKKKKKKKRVTEDEKEKDKDKEEILLEGKKEGRTKKKDLIRQEGRKERGRRIKLERMRIRKCTYRSQNLYLLTNIH